MNQMGRYQIRKTLGQGGMATVYLAYDPGVDREVALKLLPREFAHSAEFRERFTREAKSTAALEHPAIVPVYDVGEEEQRPYIVMRYLPGGTLTERIQAGPIALERAYQIIARLAGAIDAAHRKGIIHRDIKPGNILFDSYDEAYLSDFGIAQIAELSVALTGSGVIGTPAYMSPEQAFGKQTLDGRSDIYSLGVVMFEMLAGKALFQADTPIALALKHISEPAPDILSLNPALPADLAHVLEIALAKNRDERYATASEMASDLGRVLQGQAITRRIISAPASGPLTEPLYPAGADAAAMTRQALPSDRRNTRRIPETANPGRRSWLLWALPLGLLALIAAAFLIFRGLGGAAGGEADFSAPLDELESLSVSIQLGASETTLSALEAGDPQAVAVQVENDDAGINPVLTTFERLSRVGTLEITQEEEAIFVLGEDPVAELEVLFSPELPLDLTVQGGVELTVLDLTDLQVRSLTLLGPGGDVEVLLPRQGEIDIRIANTFQQVTISRPEETGDLLIRSITIVDTLGPVDFELPLAGRYEVGVNSPYGQVSFLTEQGIELRIEAPGEFLERRLADRYEEVESGVWQSAAYEGAANAVLIRVESSTGTIAVER